MAQLIPPGKCTIVFVFVVDILIGFAVGKKKKKKTAATWILYSCIKIRNAQFSEQQNQTAFD